MEDKEEMHFGDSSGWTLGERRVTNMRRGMTEWQKIIAVMACESGD